MARVAKKALQSNTGKKLANAVKEQAIESSINVASDLAKGKDLRQSFQDEFENAKASSKKRAIDIGIDYLKGSEKRKKRKKVSLKKNTGKKLKRDIFV